MKNVFINLLLMLIGSSAALLILEVGLRCTKDEPAIDEESTFIALHSPCNCPYLYHLNPAHPAALTRNWMKNHSIERLSETFNILVLGDSVAYGAGIPDRKQPFPQRLEDLLAKRFSNIEVLNSALNGYGPYNQLKQYEALPPDVHMNLVIVVFVMNDIVNPAAHWGYDITDIPMEAYPNPLYYEDHHHEQAQAGGELLRRIRDSINVTNIAKREESYTVVDGRRWPTYITGEDTISIEVLTDYTSPEWVWLRGIYDRLADEVASNGARLALVIVPLAYQMDAEYPFLPQNLFARYCQERSLLCLDLLPTFRERGKTELFLNPQNDYLDIWHLSDRGHTVVADELITFIESHNLLGE